MKIVINTCYGGFGLSNAAIQFMKDAGSDFNSQYDIQRDDPNLVKAVETLGEAANGFCAELEVIEIPDGVEWEIDEYDGKEHVAEKHRKWY